MNAHRSLRARGFTLVEAVITLAILGVVVGMIAVFIKMPVQNYADSTARAELTDIADTALRRMARDVRLALPNSVRIDATGHAMEFLLTKTGGRYLAAEDKIADQVLDFTDTSKTTFTVVGAMPTGKEAILAGDYVVIYNLGSDSTANPANAYSGGNRALISSVDTANKHITMASNPFALNDPPLTSPTSRFQVVTGPVSYVCNGAADGSGKLWRYSGYPIPATQSNPPTGSGLQSALIAGRVVSCQFSYSSLASQRTALLSMTLVLKANNSDDQVTLHHQIHVFNTP